MPELTNEQKQVIEISPSNILVSAAAGSGKTFVMTKRIAERIKSRKAGIKDLLVMTFTDAAAKNMKDRISEELRESLDSEKDKEIRSHILDSIRSMPASHISTIHSFCLDVIRDFYYEADKGDEPLLLPGFKIAPEAEAKVLFDQAMEDILREKYEICDEYAEDNRSKLFLRLAETYGAEKSDDPLKKIISETYSFLRSLPDYDERSDRMLASLKETAEDFDRSSCFAKIKEALRLRVSNAMEGAEKLEKFLATSPAILKDPQKNKEKIDQWNRYLSFLHGMHDLIKREDLSWDDIYSSFIQAPGIEGIKGKGSPERDLLKDLLKHHFAELMFMGTGAFGTSTYNKDFLYDTEYVFYADRKRVSQDIADMHPVVKEILSLVRDVDTRYSRMKQELNILDFSDFEHLALKILRKQEILEHYRRKYKEIYIDEYQDTSAIQEEIIRLISEGNLFMVGDVKQSIYRFRHAKPEIFMEKANEYSGKGEGNYLTLNKNFRSSSGIIEAVNDIFVSLMSKGAGEIDYTQGHELVCGVTGKGPGNVCLLLTDLDSEDIEEEISKLEDISDMTSYEAEACTIAAEMADLFEQGVSPGEIAVLARTINICDRIAEILENTGIPVIRQKADEEPDIYELKVLVSFLEILDNPRQDIPLASVMLSPIFEGGFSEDELLTIRNETGPDKCFFHESVSKYISEGKDSALESKLERFMDMIAEYRNMIMYMDPGDVIAKMLRDTGLVIYSAKMPDGQRRLKYMNRFAQWLGEFCSGRKAGVHDAVIYLKDLKERGSGESPFSVEEITADKVKVMTIHHSKGLEYRVVFLAGTSGRLMGGKTSSDIAMTQDDIPGIWYIDPDGQFKYPTPTVFAVQESVRKAEMAEELRLLYVAMTRAEERLYISGTYKGKECRQDGKNLAKVAERVIESAPDTVIPDHIVLSAKTLLDWIIMGLVKTGGADLECIGVNGNIEGTENNWIVRSISAAESAAVLEQNASKVKRIFEGAEEEKSEPRNENLDRDVYIDSLENKFFSGYKYHMAASQPQKYSVGEIKSKAEMSGDEQTQSLPAGGINLNIHSPGESAGNKMTPVMEGVIVHSFLRYADIERMLLDPSCDSICAHIDEMLEASIFLPEEAELLKTYAGNFSAYYSSDLASRMQRNISDLRREEPFTLAIKCRDIFPEEGFASQDSVLVQGIIDCWFLENGRAFIVDYKTDKLSGSDVHIAAQLKKRYGVQLSMYTRAVSEIYGIEVCGACIWLFSSNKEYNIPIENDLFPDQ